jgi:hypothetical protein
VSWRHVRESFRQAPCAWCGCIFYICRSCDRGHIYCSDPCRHRGRAQSHRRANQRHQRSEGGRQDHRDRQREYRRRLRHRLAAIKALAASSSPTDDFATDESVTDVGSLTNSSCGITTAIAPLHSAQPADERDVQESNCAPKINKKNRQVLVVCICCRRRASFVHVENVLDRRRRRQKKGRQ